MTTHREAMTEPTSYRLECGTTQGWWAHRRAREKACQPCRRAIAVGLREESVFSLGQSLDELTNQRQGRRFWNPNIAGTKR